jgi:hypothetical protein
MKKLICILVLLFALQVSAQDQSNWLTDNSIALKQSDTQKKPVLVFVTDNQKSEALETLQETFFASEGYKTLASKVILLKLDISDTQSTNARLGIHYTKQKTAPGLSLIDKNGKAIIEPLVDFSSKENVRSFITLLNDKL